VLAVDTQPINPVAAALTAPPPTFTRTWQALDGDWGDYKWAVTDDEARALDDPTPVLVETWVRATADVWIYGTPSWCQVGDETPCEEASVAIRGIPDEAVPGGVTWIAVCVDHIRSGDRPRPWLA
jgi:hypothetical protein